MFSITVSDHVMVAHSLRGEVFGPAQGLHGATYVVEATFRSTDLDADGIVLDLGWAATTLREVLGPLGYRNLDDLPALAGLNTTTEVLARWVGDALAERVRALPDTGHLTGVAVTLRENPVAWASYERGL